MLLVPLGFVLMWESVVTVPEDDSPYPWRRRIQGAIAVLAAFGVVVLTHSLTADLLPHTWWVGLLVSGLLGWMGLEVFRRLRPRSAVVDTQDDA